MAITFPRDMPELPGNRTLIRECSFDPMFQQIVAPTRGGLVQVANIGTELWAMKFATSPLDYQQAMEWMAWLHSLRGGARSFKAWHPLRRFPYAYPSGFGGMTRAGGGSFDGTCTLNAIGGSRDTITLTTLPASFAFSIGDMVSFPAGASQVLVRVLESATANGSGAVTLTIEPALPVSAVTGVTATLTKPWCLAVVDAQSIQGPVQPGFVQAVSFNAVQTY